MNIKALIRSKMMEFFFHIKEKTYKSRIKYIYENNHSDKLIIIFPAFPSGDKPMYNYYKTLKDVKMDKLFILDNFGYRGSYLLYENGGGHFSFN